MRRLSILLVLISALAFGASAQDDSPAAELVRVFGRGVPVLAAWSPDGAQLAVVTSIGAWVYDTADWDAEPRLYGTSYRATTAGFSPAGGLLAVGLADGTAHAFDVASGAMLDGVVGGPVPERGAMANYNVPARYAGFADQQTDRGQTSGGTVGSQTLVDADGATLRLRVVVAAGADTPPPPSPVSPDGTLSVVIEDDRVSLVDAGGTSVRDLAGYTRPILGLGFSSLGDALIARETGGAARVVDVGTGEELGSYPTPWPTIGALISAVDPVSQRAAVANRPNGVLVIDPIHGAISLPGPESLVMSLAFEPGGARLAAGFADGTLRMYDSLDSAARSSSAYAHFGHVLGIAWLPESGVLVTAGEEGYIKLWRADAEPFGGAQLIGTHADEATAAVVSPADPTLFATAGLDGTIRLWRLRK